MIGIINYGLGNLKSISGMLRKIGSPCEIVHSNSNLGNFSKFILPGVGSFDHGMNGLRERGFINPLIFEVIEKNKPLLGICLGMQLLGQCSEEGKLPGLGWLDCKFKKFQFNLSEKCKVPHMGWNSVRAIKKNPLLAANEINEPRFYFVHSFYADPRESMDVIAITNYGGDVAAAISKRNIFGVQFHPEKSHRYGMELLKRFSEI